MFPIQPNTFSSKVLLTVAKFLAQLPISLKAVQRIAIAINLTLGISVIIVKILFASLMLWWLLPYVGFPLGFLQCVAAFVIVSVLKIPLVKEKAKAATPPIQLVQMPQELMNALSEADVGSDLDIDDDDDEGDFH